MTKRRANGEGTICQLKDGRWQARYYDLSSKRRAVYGATRAKAAAKLAAAIRDRDSGIAAPSAEQSVGEFLDDWLESTIKPIRAPKTHESYETQVRVHLKPRIGRIRLAKLQPSDVERLQHEMRAEELAESSITYARAVLRSALQKALKLGIVSRNVVPLTDAPRSVRPEPRYPSPDEARRLIEALDGHPHRALYITALATGLRQGEALGLRWSDIDLDGCSLTVRHALKRHDKKYSLGEPKTKQAQRTLSLPSVAVEALRRHRDEQVEAMAAHGDLWDDGGIPELVFTTSGGGPLHGSTVTHALQRVLAQAGLPKYNFRNLRHACPSYLTAQGVHPRIVAEQMGHSQINITMDLYSHVAPSSLADAANVIEDVLSDK